jgi:predicted nucleic-acid-binding protein
MNRAYVDANVVVRLVTGDPVEMAEQAAGLFRRVDNGELEIIIDEIVVLETVWVMSSFYGFTPAQIAPLMRTFLVGRGIICDQRIELLQALTLYDDKNIDFADALLAVKVTKHNVRDIYSFDQHFERIESISRLRP